ncbi:ADP-forming succinate--CoA ligase subunit beta [Cupriavidus pauculus]|uniref:Succinate--CoA ligase [ADP-forming] subunit beta n=1 Tax=Cupriavidus pauculus TaxID=82633 RepID=A0A2N5CA71_9BURK|nr:ADP-forming succinate--CoA ligase subunit beta [Cupriavidus pauculus]PLP99091.1 ADP-forming succinate--CoA ligase subunit beta [Cupriavidus pauculus]
MHIHEHQAKELLRRYDVPVPQGCVAFTPDEATHAARKLGGTVWVVKSQIHAGGRGVGRFVGDGSGKGGVRIATSIDEVHAHAMQMLGKTLVTRQTGPAGRTVRRLYIEKGFDIARELYLGILIDRATSRITIMASTEGGIDIEEVAARTPEKIMKVAIDPASGIQPFHARRLASSLRLSGKQVGAATRFILSVYRAFTELDASIVEINPLVVTGSGDVMALDAKFSFDDNALFRHPEIEAMRDESEEDPAEAEAARHGLSYVRLDGNIGCMVNGAGLAMATMDLIKRHGAAPANFLDVGGGATQERVTTAFRLIAADPKVEGILVNIFGGIMRCDVIAEGVVAAAHDVDLTVPLVVRLEGTHVEQGRQILRNSGLPILSASHLGDAAEKVVAAVRATQKKGGK